jgi:hypothetical protein
MRLFYRIKRDHVGFWVKMYSDPLADKSYYAATRRIEHSDVRGHALAAFESFAADVRAHRKSD